MSNAFAPPERPGKAGLGWLRWALGVVEVAGLFVGQGVVYAVFFGVMVAVGKTVKLPTERAINVLGAGLLLAPAIPAYMYGIWVRLTSSRFEMMPLIAAGLACVDSSAAGALAVSGPSTPGGAVMTVIMVAFIGTLVFIQALLFSTAGWLSVAGIARLMRRRAPTTSSPD